MKVIIVGGGQVGSYIANLLNTGGHDVTVIEHRKNVFAMLQKELPAQTILYGSGTDPDILEKAGVAHANVVAAVTGKDEINLVVSTLAKMEYGVPRVVARVNNPKNTWLYNRGMGVDVCVNQADLMAHFIVEEMDIKEMFTLMRLGRGDFSIVQMKVSAGSRAAQRPIRELALPQNAVLVAVTRDSSILIPRGGTQLQEGDEILALADSAGRAALGEVFG